MTTREALTVALNLLSECTSPSQAWLDRFQELLRADLKDEPAEPTDLTDERWHQYALSALRTCGVGITAADACAFASSVADTMLLHAKAQASK